MSNKLKIAIKIFISSAIITFFMLFTGKYANADDALVAVSTSLTVSDPLPAINDNSTVTLETIQSKLDTATAILNNVAQTDSLSIISTIQSNVPNTDTSTAISIATTQEPIATAILDANTKIQTAYSVIDSATATIQIAQSALNFLNNESSTVTLTQDTLLAETNKLPDLQDAESTTCTTFYTENSNLGTATSNVDIAQIQLTNAQTDLANSQLTVSITNGIKATTYAYSGSTGTPLPTDQTTPLSIATVPSLSFNWGSGQVLNSGRVDNVIIKFEGTITLPNEAVMVKYNTYADDGTKLYIDGLLAINNWRDQGPSYSAYSQYYDVSSDKQQDFVIWYYEHGGGAVVNLGWLIIRADGSGYFTFPQADAFSSVTTIQDPIKVAAVNTAQNNLTSAQSAYSAQLTIRDTAYQAWQDAIHAVNAQQSIIDSAQAAYDTAQSNLIDAQNLAQITLQTASSLVDTATIKVQDAVTSMNNSLQVTTAYYAEQQRLANEARIAAQQAANAKAAADAKAAEDARIAAEQKAKEAQAAADKAKADAEIQAQKDAQAKADAAKAEADAKAKADADATLADKKAKDEAAKAAQEKANAKSEADKKVAADAKITADKAAKDQAAKDAKAQEDAKQAELDKAKKDAIGVLPNNPDQLSDTVVKEAPAEILVEHVQEDKSGVENGGIQFFGTKSAPQVVGEDGKLTPPAPPPGSGLPIPADAITTKDTFIGQPGGTTFNAPDIAVPVILVPLEGAIASVPGAEALNQAFVAMSNIGNDMSPVTRKKAKKILVLTIAVSAIRRRFGQ